MSTPLWFTNLAAYSLQIALLALIGAGLAAALRLRAPRVTLAYWHGLLAACLALPLIEPWKQAVLVLTNDVGSVGIQVGSLAVKPGHPVFPIFNLIALALGLGVAYRVFRTAFGLLQLRRYGQRARAWQPVPEAVNQLRARLGVAPALLLSDEISGPVTFGSFRPVVLFPARFAQMDEDGQLAIVCHELIHVRQGHWFFNLAEEFVLALFWFHPALAWMVGRIRLAREQSVDREVLQLTGARQPYLRALLDFAAGPKCMLTVPAPEFMQKNQLTQRVALMMKEASMSKSRLVFSLTFALAVLFATAQVVVRAFPLKGRPFLAPAPAARVELMAAGELNEQDPSPAQEPAEPKTSPATTGQHAPKLQPIHKVNPVYPPLAKLAKIEGIVKLEITVEENGDVSDVKVISGQPQLAQAAMEAVREWKYPPQPTEMESTVTVNFTLAKDEKSDEEEFAEVKARLARLQAEQQAQMTHDQIKEAAAIKAEEDMLTAKLLAGEQSNQMQDRQQQIAEMKAEKASLEKRIADAEQALKAAQDNGERTFTPKPVKTVGPIYPAEAMAAHVQGDVVLQVTLDEDGKVSGVEAESGPPALVQAAITAVKQWQFSKPFQAPVATTVTLSFALGDSHSGPSSTQPPAK